MSSETWDIFKLREEWKNDSTIDKADPGLDSLKIPSLHAKYLNLLSEKRVNLQNLSKQLKVKERKLRDWIKGRNNGEELGRSVFQLELSTKEEERLRIESDPDYVEIKSKVDSCEECIIYIKDVISQINQRNYQIKNYIDFIKWSQGSHL